MKGWIGVKALNLLCHLGISEEERAVIQTVQVDVALYCDMQLAAEQDDLSHAIDYRTVEAEFCRIASERPYKLIESLGAAFMKRLREFPDVLQIRLLLRKPGALPQAQATFVELQWPDGYL